MLIRLFISLILVQLSFTSSASSLTYGKFSPIQVYLKSEPVLFLNQASIFVEFDVYSITPVNRGVPKSYYDNAIRNPRACKVTLPLTLSDGKVKFFRDAKVICPTEGEYGYAGTFPVSLSYLEPGSKRYVDVQCKTSKCRRFIMPSGAYLMRVLSDSTLKYQRIPK